MSGSTTSRITSRRCWITTGSGRKPRKPSSARNFTRLGKTVRLWDAATGATIGQPLRHEDRVNGAVYSPDGKRILSWSFDKTLRLWDAATGAAIGLPLRHEDRV